MVVYRWRAEFDLPGVPIARPLELGSIRLTPEPRDEGGHSRSSGYYVLETERSRQAYEAEAEALSRLELVSMAAAALGGSVRAPVVRSVRLENRDALEAAGVRTPLHDPGLLMTFSVVAGDIDEDALTAGYRQAVALPDPDASLWRRAVRWIWKANGDADPYDQFLALWIAFNVLYGPHKQGGESSGIRNYFAHAIPAEADAEDFLADVSSENVALLGASGLTLRERRGPRRIADEIRAAAGLPPERQSGRGLLTLIFLGLYAVRCGIVHDGGATLPQDNEIRLVWASVHIFKPALMRLLRRRLGVRIATGGVSRA